MPFILLLNNDTEMVNADVVRVLLASAGEGVAAVGPIVRSDDDTVWSTGGRLSLWTGRAGMDGSVWRSGSPRCPRTTTCSPPSSAPGAGDRIAPGSVHTWPLQRLLGPTRRFWSLLPLDLAWFSMLNLRAISQAGCRGSPSGWRHRTSGSSATRSCRGNVELFVNRRAEGHA